MYRIGKSKERNIYISIIGGVTLCSIVIMFVYAIVLLGSEIPSDIKIMLNQEGRFSSAFPITASFNEDCVGTISVDNKLLKKNNLSVSVENDFSIKGNKIGKYKANVKAFGVITLKKINLEVIENKKLVIEIENKSLSKINEEELDTIINLFQKTLSSFKEEANKII